MNLRTFPREQRRIGVGVQLPMVGRRPVEGCLVPAHRVGEGSLEQPVVAGEQLDQRRCQSVAPPSIELRQPGHRLAGHDQRLEWPGRPERDDDQPVVVLDDHPGTAQLLCRVVQQQPPAGRAPDGVAAMRPRGPPPEEARSRPRSAHVDAGSRLPSPRRGSRTPGPSDSVRPSSAVWSAHTSITPADVVARQLRQGQVVTWREAEHTAGARLSLGRQQALLHAPVRSCRAASAAKSLVNTNVPS